MSTLDREDFRRAGHRVIDMIADYWRDIERRRIAPADSLEILIERFAHTLSDDGIGLEAAVDQLPALFDASVAMSHPLYLGLVNSSPLPEAVLADLVISALDNNGGASHQGPANVAAEREVVRWMAEQLQYDGDGMILAGGSQATLQALQIAKFCRFPDWLDQGPMSLSTRPRVYLSSATHFSSARAAQVIGLGNACIARVSSTGRGEIDPVALSEQMEMDLRHGWQPFAVLATSGSTGTGAMDPLDEISSLCQQHGAWLHVDACYGGAAALIDSQRGLFAGLTQADSIAIDLHKWFFMPLTAGVLLTRHEEKACELFEVPASYIPAVGHVQAYSRGLPTSRRSAGLVAWFALRSAGWNAIRQAIERNIQLTRRLEAELARQGFRVMPRGQLSIACARWEPKGWPPDAVNHLQQSISAEIQGRGEAWFATTECDAMIWLRFNMVNLHSQRQHVDRLAQLVSDSARRLSESRP